MNNEIILFENQNIKLEGNMKDETIGKQINNALKKELDNSTVAKFATI